MARINGNFDLDGVLSFPSGANNQLSIRAFSNQSPTNEPASGQIRFMQVGNEEGYWYLQNNPVANINDFNASSYPSGQRIATLDDISASNSLGALTDVDTNGQVSGNLLVYNGSSWVPSGNLFSLENSKPVDARPVSGNIVPDASGSHVIGTDELKFQEIVTTSGSFGERNVLVGNNVEIRPPVSFDGHALNIFGSLNQTHTVKLRQSGGTTNASMMLFDKVANSGDAIQIRYSGLESSVKIEHAGKNNLGSAIHISNNADNASTNADAIFVDNYGGFALETICYLGSLGGVQVRGSSVDGIVATGSFSDAALDITNSNPSAGDGISIVMSAPLGAGNGVYISHGGTGNGITVDNFAGGSSSKGIAVDQSTSGRGIELIQADHSSNDSLYIQQVGTTNGAGNAIRILDGNSGAGSSISVTKNNGTGDAISFTNNATGDAVAIAHTTTTSNSALRISDSNSGAGQALIIDKTAGTGGSAVSLSILHAPNTRAAVIDSAATSAECQQNNVSSLSYAGISTLLTAARTASSSFSFITTLSNTALSADAEHRLRGDGALQSDIAASTPADYAEYFETLDPSGLPYGIPVTLSTGDNAEKIIQASGDMEVIGITSAAPAFIADSAWAKWQGKYLKDEFGAYVLTSSGTKVLNPEYDPEQEYISRENRPEWITVGLLGKIWCRCAMSGVQKGDRVSVNENGMFTPVTKMQINTSGLRTWPVLEVGEYNSMGYRPVRILFR